MNRWKATAMDGVRALERFAAQARVQARPLATSGRALLVHPIVALGLRFLLGGLFVASGVLKLRDPAGFAQEIANYQLLPVVAPYLAIALPTTELMAGLALIVLPPIWRRAGALTVGALMVMFLVAAVTVLVRGVNVDCGCFGTGSGPVGWTTVLRDLVLLAMAAVLASPPERATPGAG